MQCRFSGKNDVEVGGFGLHLSKNVLIVGVKHDEGTRPPRQVLLVLQVLAGRDDDIEAALLSRTEPLTIRHFCPPLLNPDLKIEKGLPQTGAASSGPKGPSPHESRVPWPFSAEQNGNGTIYPRHGGKRNARAWPDGDRTVKQHRGPYSTHGMRLRM